LSHGDEMMIAAMLMRNGCASTVSADSRRLVSSRRTAPVLQQSEILPCAWSGSGTGKLLVPSRDLDLGRFFANRTAFSMPRQRNASAHADVEIFHTG